MFGASQIWVCVSDGATLVFTSSRGQAVNVDALQEYIYHRLYSFDLKKEARLVVRGCCEQWDLMTEAR